MIRQYENRALCKLPRKKILVGLASLSIVLLLGLTLQGIAPTSGLTVNVPRIYSDRDEIELTIAELGQAIRASEPTRIKACLPAGYILKAESKGSAVKTDAFSIEIKRIEISRDSAFVTCDATDGYDLKVKNNVIILLRDGSTWRIADPQEIENAIQHIMNGGGHLGGSSIRMDPSSIVEAPYSVVGRPHPGVSASLITRSLSQQYLERDVFAEDAVLSMDGISLDTNDYDIGFVADGYWDRIVYGRQDPQDRWLKSYGDNAGDYRFSGSRALTIDTFDTLFVADTYNGKIAKLFYNRSAKQVYFISAFSVPGIRYPSDVVFYPNFTPCTTSDGDYIWVAEESENRVARVTRAGVVSNMVKYYQYNSVRYPLSKPEKILVAPWGPVTYWSFIDGERNAFVTSYLSLIDDSTCLASNVTEFDATSSNLTTIGFDMNSQWWVGDATREMYHIFSYAGIYAASVRTDREGTALFSSPHSITRPTLTTKYCDGYFGYYGSLGIVTSDLWNSSTGLRFFYPGADIVNYSVSQVGDGFQFQWRLTNRSKCTLQILNSANQIIESIEAIQPCGDGTLHREYSALPYGQLKFRIAVLPYFNDNYGPYVQSPVVKELPFANVPPAPMNVAAAPQPWSVALTWDPVPGVQGYRVYVNDYTAGSYTNTSSFTHMTPSPVQTYTYRVKATNAGADGPFSNPITGKALEVSQLSSTSGDATQNNNQRRLASDYTTSTVFPEVATHLIYPSGNGIFYTSTRNSGQTWSPPEQLLCDDPIMLDPSIDVFNPWFYNYEDQIEHPIVVSQVPFYDQYFFIYSGFRRFRNESGGDPPGGPYIWQGSYSGNWELYTDGGSRAKPVVAYPFLFFLQGGGPNPGYYYNLAEYASSAGPFYWTTASRVPTDMSANARNLSAIRSILHGDGSQFRMDTIHLAWEENNSIKYRRVLGQYINGTPSINWGTVETIASGLFATGTNHYPSISIDYCGRPSVVWEFEDVVAQEDQTDGSSSSQHRQIRFSRRESTGWSPISAFSAQGRDYSHPSITRFASTGASNELALVWQTDQYRVRTSRLGSSWASVQELPEEVVYPTAIGYQRSGAQLFAGTGLDDPHTITVRTYPTILPQEEEDESAYRETVLSTGDDALSVFVGNIVFADEPTNGIVDIGLRRVGLRSINNAHTEDNLDSISSSLCTDSFVARRGSRISGFLRMVSVTLDSNTAWPAGGKFTCTLEIIRAQSGEKVDEIGSWKIDRKGKIQFRGRKEYEFRTDEGEVRIRYALSSKRLAFSDMKLIRHFRSGSMFGDSLQVEFLGKNSANFVEVPKIFDFHSNYPNPFNPSTTIRFDLPEAAFVSLTVCDLLGREVTELVNGFKNEGYHSITWNAKDFASGVYFARFTATDRSGNVRLSKVSKLLLTK